MIYSGIISRLIFIYSYRAIGVLQLFLNIQSKETGTGGGDGAIKKARSCRQSGVVGCCVTKEFQILSANGDTDLMSFGIVGPDTVYKL